MNTTSGTFRLQRICFKLLISKRETEVEHELFQEERPRHVECIWLDCSVHLAGLHSCFVRGISLGNTVPQALATPR